MSFVPQFVAIRKRVAEERGTPFRLKRPTIQRFPLSAERGYIAALLNIIKLIRDDINAMLLPELGRISRASGVRRDGVREDVSDVEAILEGIEGNITARINNTHLRGLSELITRYRNQTSSFSRQQTIRQMRRMLGVDAFPTEAALQAQMDLYLANNVKEIKSLSGDYVGKVMSSVRRHVQAGNRPSLIEKDLKKQFNITANKAKLIARDQTNKLNGNLTQMRQTDLGIEEYTWRTSRDEIVRPTHRVKEGNVYRWDDPPADTGHPGEDYQCRCSAEPYLEGVPQVKESKKKFLAGLKSKRAALRKKLGPKATRIARENPDETA